MRDIQDCFEGFAHIALYTSDLEKSLSFYEKIGGRLEQRSQYTDETGTKLLALLSLAGLTIELMQRPPGVSIPKKEGVVSHFAIYVKDMDETARNLKSLGVQFLTPSETVLPDIFGGVRCWYILGPSGEHIELLQKM